MKNVQRAAWGEILGQLFERFINRGLASALLGSHDVIATDALGGLLHASFQFAESPADADTIKRLRIFALALRTEGRCQRFAF